MRLQKKQKMQPVPNQERNDQGAILVITLLIIAALTALTLAFSEESRVELNLAQFSRETLQARQMAAAGFNLVLTEIDKPDDVKNKEIEETKRDWSQLGPLTFPDPLPDGITVEARYLDESGKINLDFLYQKLKENKETDVKQMKEQLGRLFTTLGVEEAASLVDPLVDWLDADSETGFMGAEDDYYQGLPNPYPCANGPLLTIDQIFLIKGFEELKLEAGGGEKKITDFLTLYGNKDGKIDINAAPPEVLRSLGEEVDVDAILRLREEKGQITKQEIKDFGIDLNKVIDHSDKTDRSYLVEIKVKVQEAEVHLKALVKQVKDKKVKEIIYWRII
jgi:general secretion pathway protein K